MTVNTKRHCARHSQVINSADLGVESSVKAGAVTHAIDGPSGNKHVHNACIVHSSDEDVHVRVTAGSSFQDRGPSIPTISTNVRARRASMFTMLSASLSGLSVVLATAQRVPPTSLTGIIGEPSWVPRSGYKALIHLGKLANVGGGRGVGNAMALDDIAIVSGARTDRCAANIVGVRGIAGRVCAVEGQIGSDNSGGRVINTAFQGVFWAGVGSSSGPPLAGCVCKRGFARRNGSVRGCGGC